MSRATAGWVAALALHAAAAAASSVPGLDTVVGRVGRGAEARAVTLAELDARSGGAIGRLLEKRRAALAAALEARIDARLLARAHGSEARAEAQLGIRAEPDGAALAAAAQVHRADLPFAPERTRAVLRHLLRAEALPRHRRAELEALRGAADLERRLPAGSGPLPEVLARVDDIEISRAETERAGQVALFRSHGRIVAEAERGFRRLRDELLAERAGGFDPRGQAEVSDAEVATYIAERPAANLEDARVRSYLGFRRTAEAREAWLAGLRRKTPSRFLLEAPTPPRVDPAELGLPRAPLLVFANLRCPPCAEEHAQLEARGEPGKRARWLPFFRVGSLALHADALAATCAAEQGSLGALERALHARRPRGADRPLFTLGLAAASVPDRETWEACVASERTQQGILTGLRAAEKIGFQRAPSFLVHGLPVEGFQGAERLDELLARGPSGREPQTKETER